MKYVLWLLVVGFLPSAAYAAETIQSFAKSFTSFLGNVIVPFLIGVAFLIFAFNAIRYFVLGGGNEEDREKAKNLAIYSVMGLVIIMIFWGIVNLLSNSLGLAKDSQPISDYVQNNNSTLGGNSRPSAGGPSGKGSQSGSPAGKSSCTQIQIDFDNNFGGPCATNQSNHGVTGDPIGDIIQNSQQKNSNDPCANGADFNENGTPCGIY
jgi:succinate dehydrogenase/fumarate reductase cytochrome b subunit